MISIAITIYLWWRLQEYSFLLKVQDKFINFSRTEIEVVGGVWINFNITQTRPDQTRPDTPHTSILSLSHSLEVLSNMDFELIDSQRASLTNRKIDEKLINFEASLGSGREGGEGQARWDWLLARQQLKVIQGVFVVPGLAGLGWTGKDLNIWRLISCITSDTRAE